MLVELVRTVTRDGLRLDGAYTRTRRASEGYPQAQKGLAAILLHGVAGNFYNSSTFEPLIPKLQELRISTLAVNTRGHDSVFGGSQGTMRRRLGAAYEIVEDCRHDIAAWIEFLRARGYEQLILIGHSLGAVKAVYAQAHERFPTVATVVAVSPPRLSYSAFMNAESSSAFWESMRTAEELLQAGRGDDLFTSKYPFPMLITASAYIDKYGSAERYNILKFAGDLTCPSLFVYGSKELASGDVPFAGLPDALALLPGGDRRTITIIEGADHFYSGLADRLAARIAEYLQPSLSSYTT
jgi:pimeloyl-ACP methyl ester carboxylesterase